MILYWVICVSDSQAESQRYKGEWYARTGYAAVCFSWFSVERADCASIPNSALSDGIVTARNRLRWSLDTMEIITTHQGICIFLFSESCPVVKYTSAHDSVCFCRCVHAHTFWKFNSGKLTKINQSNFKDCSSSPTY